jgi:Family of unknown function (DUF5996)
VADFDRQLHRLLDQLGVDVPIREDPYGVPITTPFPNDTEHAAYDPDNVLRYWQILDWVDTVLAEFSGWYCGKQSPVHLFWHSLDLAVTRFSGRGVGPTSRWRRPRHPRGLLSTKSSRSASGPAMTTPTVRPSTPTPRPNGPV